MSKLDQVIEARERQVDATHVAAFLEEILRALEAALTVEDVAKLIPAPRSFTARLREALEPGSEDECPSAVCVPVRRAHPRDGDPQLRLLATPWESEVGIVVSNTLIEIQRARTPSIVFAPYPHAAAPLAGAWEPESEHLDELIREHRLRGVILGIQHTERQGHALAYDDEPALLTLTDVLERRNRYLPREREARKVNWRELPFASLIERTY